MFSKVLQGQGDGVLSGLKDLQGVSSYLFDLGSIKQSPGRESESVRP